MVIWLLCKGAPGINEKYTCLYKNKLYSPMAGRTTLAVYR